MNKDDMFNYGLITNSLGIEEPGVSGINTDLINRVLDKQFSYDQEIEVISFLLSILKDELTEYATSGHVSINNNEISFLIISIRRLLKRNNFSDLKLPFSNYREFYDNWRELGLTGSGSWSARSGYVSSLLKVSINEVKDRLDELIFNDLASPACELVPLENWDRIITEIEQLKSRYSTARTSQDFSAVGTACVRVIEGLSRVAYIHNIHGDQTREEPEISKTDIRIGQIISKGLAGSANEELRSLAKHSNAFAHKIKHSTTPNAFQAGIACDSVILLVSIINRIENERIRVSSISM